MPTNAADVSALALRIARAGALLVAWSAAIAVAFESAWGQAPLDRAPRWSSTERVSGSAPELGKEVVLRDDLLLAFAPGAGVDLLASPVNQTGTGLVYRQGSQGWGIESRLDPTGCFAGGSIQRCGFGLDVVASRDWMFVRSAGIAFSGPEAGLYHVYDLRSGSPELSDILRSPLNPFGQESGWGVRGRAAASGSRLAVGAPGFGAAIGATGGVFIYEADAFGRFRIVDFGRRPPLLSPQSVFTSFGSATALDGDTLVVGEPSNSGGGRVHVFEHDGARWQLVQTLVPPGWPQAPALTIFGLALAVDEASRTIVVTDARGQGRITIFERPGPGAAYGEVATFGPLESGTASNPANFGRQLDIEKGRIVVGAIFERVNGVGSGAVHLLARTPAGWVREKRFATPLDGTTQVDGVFFGAAVDLNGDRLLVGETRWGPGTNNGLGRVHIFEISRGSEICAAVGAPELNIMFATHDETEVTASVFGLPQNGIGVFVAGDPSAGTPFGSNALCVGRPVRISPPLAFSDQPALYHSFTHPDPTSPASIAFQFVYTSSQGAFAQGASSARVID